MPASIIDLQDIIENSELNTPVLNTTSQVIAKTRKSLKKFIDSDKFERYIIAAMSVDHSSLFQVITGDENMGKILKGTMTDMVSNLIQDVSEDEGDGELVSKRNVEEE